MPDVPEPTTPIDDSLLRELLAFLREEKKWWLAPLVLTMVMLSALILAAEGSAISPFIYMAF